MKTTNFVYVDINRPIKELQSYTDAHKWEDSFTDTISVSLTVRSS